MAHRRVRFLATLLRRCSNLQRTSTRFLWTWETPVCVEKSVAGIRCEIRPRFDARSVSSVSPQETFESHAPYLYKIRIITGNVRGAGTMASIRLQLIGTRGESDVVMVSKDNGFPQGSVETAVLSISTDIGALRMVRVERDDTDGTVSDESWFLEKLLIDEPTGSQLCFPCMQWFGLSSCGVITGRHTRHLRSSSFFLSDRCDI